MERRIEFLEGRAKAVGQRGVSYDLAEIAALSWAVQICRAVTELGMADDLERESTPSGQPLPHLDDIFPTP